MQLEQTSGSTAWATDGDPDCTHIYSNLAYALPIYSGQRTGEIAICVCDGILTVVPIGKPVDAANFGLYGLEILQTLPLISRPISEWVPVYFNRGAYYHEDNA